MRNEKVAHVELKFNTIAVIFCHMRSAGEIGLMMGPSERLYRTKEAAEKGLALVMLMNAWWSAITHG